MKHDTLGVQHSSWACICHGAVVLDKLTVQLKLYTSYTRGKSIRSPSVRRSKI